MLVHPLLPVLVRAPNLVRGLRAMALGPLLEGREARLANGMTVVRVSLLVELL